MFIYLNCVYITITISIQNIKPTIVKFKHIRLLQDYKIFYVVKINDQLNTTDAAWKANLLKLQTSTRHLNWNVRLRNRLLPVCTFWKFISWWTCQFDVWCSYALSWLVKFYKCMPYYYNIEKTRVVVSWKPPGFSGEWLRACQNFQVEHLLLQNNRASAVSLLLSCNY